MAVENIPVPATPSAAPAAPKRALLELFGISVLILFLELACIRWFPANVLFLTFFTNTVLLACFLGMSLGCLAVAIAQLLEIHPVSAGVRALAASRVEVMQDKIGEVVNIGSPRRRWFSSGPKWRWQRCVPICHPGRGARRVLLRGDRPVAGRTGTGTRPGPVAIAEPRSSVHSEYLRQHCGHRPVLRMFVAAAFTRLVVPRRRAGSELFPISTAIFQLASDQRDSAGHGRHHGVWLHAKDAKQPGTAGGLVALLSA